MSLNDRIKEARLGAKLTQEQLASLVGVAKSTITGYEKGNRVPTAAMVGDIALATKVDANFLYQDEVNSLHDYQATPYELENIIKKYRLLDEHGKKMIEMVMQAEYERCNPVATNEQSNDNQNQSFEDYVSAQMDNTLIDLSIEPSQEMKEKLKHHIYQFEKTRSKK